MRFLLRTFLRGLLFVVPAVATVWLFVSLFLWIDGLIELPEGSKAWKVPYLGLELRHGLGFLITVAFVFGVGLLTSNVLTRWLLRRVERLFRRVPVVKLVYSSIKDVIEAFVSERKKFDRPVLLALGSTGGGAETETGAATPELEVIGFVTREDLAEFGRPDKVAVYVPQSYNFAANLILVPRARITPVDLPAGDVMTFVVSGGVSGAAERSREGRRRARRGD